MHRETRCANGMATIKAHGAGLHGRRQRFHQQIKDDSCKGTNPPDVGGNTFEFIALAPNEQIGNEQIAVGIEEVKRIEKIFTTFSDNSVTNEVNRMAGVSPVEVPENSSGWFSCSEDIGTYARSFDLSYGSLDKDF